MNPQTVVKAWTFLSNHGHVLIQLSRNPEARIREIAQEVGITERSAQSILADLADAGYVHVERIGRRNHYTVNTAQTFRHPSEADTSISALLEIFR